MSKVRTPTLHGIRVTWRTTGHENGFFVFPATDPPVVGDLLQRGTGEAVLRVSDVKADALSLVVSRA